MSSSVDPVDPYGLPCQVFVEMVTDYLEGALGTDDVARLEAHLSVCPPCVHVIDQWRETVDLAGQLAESDVDELDPEVRSDLMAAFRTLRADS